MYEASHLFTNFLHSYSFIVFLFVCLFDCLFVDCSRNHFHIQKTRIFFFFNVCICNLLIRYMLHLLFVPLFLTVPYLLGYNQKKKKIKQGLQ